MKNIIQILEQKINITHILMFDLDGTLVNTDIANLLSYKKAIQQIMDLNLDLLYSSKERFNRKQLKAIFPKLSKIEYQQIIQLKNKLYSQYLNKTTLNSLLIEIINKYSKTNKIILVINSHKERADIILKYHKLIDTFKHKFYKEDQSNINKISKFKYALNYLKLQPTSIVIFENEDLEINNAILSGIPSENIISI